jgi:Replication-relaxation
MNARRSRGRIEALRGALSHRDIKILTDLQHLRLLTARQIQRLHFTGGSELSRARRARRVCRRLHTAGLISRMDRRIGGVHAGSAGFIYSLDSAGQIVLNGPGPAGGKRRRRPWQPSAMFQDHTLEVSELYVTVRETEATEPDVEVIGFQAEPGCWRDFASPAAGPVVLKPDAFVRLGVGEFEQVSFVEIDRGTEHAPAIGRKLHVYVDAYLAGVEQGEQDGGAVFPNVVWIVPDDRRGEFLARQIARLPPEHRDLFTITTKQHQLDVLKGGTP